MYAQIITTKVSENANSRVLKWHGWRRLGKVITLAGVIQKGFLGEMLYSWIEGCVGFRQEVAGLGPASLIPTSTHR